MMEKKTRQELLEDADFIRFCTRPTEADKAYWANYLAAYPDEYGKLEEAKTFLLALFGILQAEERGQELDRLKRAIEGTASTVSNETSSAPPAIRSALSWRKISWYAAAVLVPLLLLYWLVRPGKTTLPAATPVAAGSSYADNRLLAANGSLTTTGTEKRTVLLPDGSKLVLNGNSSLSVAAQFGVRNRTVHLSGEAFFEVEHNDQLPFLVETDQFTVKVHGTSFNVRAYRGAPVTETSLLRGSVEILPADSSSSIFLKPNQKLVYRRSIKPSLVAGSTVGKELPKPELAILPITISRDGNAIIETVWTRNALEINDERFDELKEKFERWFRVSIVFEDEAIKRFRFTASFENIPLEQALEAMQLSNAFYYESDGQVLKIRSK